MVEEHELNKEEPGKETQENKEELTVGRVSLGSQTIGFYFSLIKFPVIFAVVLGIAYFLAQKNFNLIWVFDLLAFGYVAFRLVKKYKGKYLEIVIAGGLTGLFIGLFSALFKLIYFWKFYYFFNLISEPAITALVGIFIGLAVGYIFFNILTAKSETKKNSLIPPSAARKSGEKGGD